MNAFADHFSGQAAEYANFRPRYPVELFERLRDASPGMGLAWDAGTGNGQAAVELARHFRQVRATDASAAQLRHAQPHPAVVYALGAEDQSGLPDASADLVACAQAAHWFDAPRFHAEARRVLKPGGLLALWGYGLPRVDSEVDALLLDFYENDLGNWWPPERRHIDHGYRELPFPFPELSDPGFHMEARLDAAAFLGFVGTWSAVARAAAAGQGQRWTAFAGRLSSLWPDGEAKVVEWPVFLRWGHKPA